MGSRKQIFFFSIATGFFLGGPLSTSPAQAQAQASNTEKVLEEVIVNAQRREQSAQEVAISITVFSQEDVANANMTNSVDIAAYTPSLNANTRFGPENASFSVRGFTQALRTTASVATYFAEVVAPRGQSVQTSGDGAGPGALFDLANIQVLKGPQGSLFGRNTTGGAILLTPQKPIDQLEGYVEYSSGDYSINRLQGVLNIPITNSFSLRLGMDKSNRDGHLNNITGVGADDLGNVDYTTLRLSTLWNITEAIENYTIVSHVDSTSHGYTSRLFACNDDTGNPFYSFTSLPCEEQLAMQAADGTDGYYDVVSTVATPQTVIEEKRIINTLTWNTGDITIKNILAYAHLRTENGSDIYGTRFTERQATVLAAPVPTPLADPNREFVVGVSVKQPGASVTSQETWVAELQAQGMAFDSRLIWQTGLYHENSKPDGFAGWNSASLVSCDLATLEGDPSNFNCYDPLGGALGGILVQKYKTEYLNQAAYLQLSYDIFESLSSSLGLRHTEDQTDGEGIKERYSYIGTVQQAPIFTTSQPSVKSTAPTGVLELNYHPNDAAMIYTKYSRGYRQGSVNPAADTGIDSHKPETVDTYEIGAKTQFTWPIPGRFNIAVFDNDFRDMQLQTGYISQTSGPTTSIFNAGKAEIKGLEVELLLQPLESLSLNLSYSKLETELLEQEDNQAKVEAAGGALAGLTYSPIADVGDELPFAPDESLVATLKYALPLSAKIGVVELGVTYVYNGEQRSAASTSTPFGLLDAYSLWNYNLNWSGIFGSAADLSAFMTNATDEEYITNVGGSYGSLGFESRMMGLPKMFGARLRYSF